MTTDNRQGPDRIPDWAAIRLFAMDVDGVLTNGRVSIFSNGVEAKEFSILDGMGLRRIIEAGIDVAWISGRPSRTTEIRARDLRIPHVFQGNRNKREVLLEIAAATGIEAAEVCYMGDDIIDIECLKWAGIGVCVPNGVPEARAASDFVTERHGGDGAVREICDYLLAARNG